MKTAVVSLISGVVLCISCNNVDTSQGNTEKLVIANDSTALKFQCPMKCQGDTAYTIAAKCPICNMNLVQVEETVSNETEHEH